METELKIPIPGTKKYIYAKQRGSLDKPVVVFVHGLTGHMDEHQFYNGARYFEKKGFSSLRFNLYDFPKDARRLMDCTLKTHAHDIDVVVDYLKDQGAKKIFAVGHSYGAPSILLSSKKNLDAIVLWDGTNRFIFEEDKLIKELQAYYLNWGVGWLTGKEMYDEAKKIDWEALYEHSNVPVKFIWAEKGELADRGMKLFKKVTGEKSQVVIKGAGHIFAEEGAARQLFDETLVWFKKFV